MYVSIEASYRSTEIVRLSAFPFGVLQSLPFHPHKYTVAATIAATRSRLKCVTPYDVHGGNITSHSQLCY